MVTACKDYVTDEGMNRIWDQERSELITKLQDCVQLYRNYCDAFQKCKRQMDERPSERPFEFSEMYIFGKFEAFCKRIEKVCCSYSNSLFGPEKNVHICMHLYNLIISLDKD